MLRSFEWGPCPLAFIVAASVLGAMTGDRLHAACTVACDSPTYFTTTQSADPPPVVVVYKMVESACFGVWRGNTAAGYPNDTPAYKHYQDCFCDSTTGCYADPSGIKGSVDTCTNPDPWGDWYNISCATACLGGG